MMRKVLPAAALLIALLALVPPSAVAGASPPPIHVYYFDAPGCPHCDETDHLVRDLRRDPQVRVREVDVHVRDGIELAVALLTVAGRGSLVMPSAPGLLVGRDYLVTGSLTPDSARAAVERYRTTGAPDLYPGAQRIKGHARIAAAGVIRQWAVLPVVCAGLLDGINPCAFAMLVFLMSYLGARGLKGRSLLGPGLLFALGVFVAYFAFGWGLLGAVLAFEPLPAVRRMLFAVAGGGCLLLAALSLRDALSLRAGAPRRVMLQLSSPMKRKVHAVIRWGTTRRLAGAGAFVAGAAVSVVELACTGQVYVPAIILLTGISETRTMAVAWLLLYCLCFIVPLLSVLALVSCGAPTRRLAVGGTRQASATKALMSVFFALASVFFVLRSVGS